MLHLTCLLRTRYLALAKTRPFCTDRDKSVTSAQAIRVPANLDQKADKRQLPAIFQELV